MPSQCKVDTDPLAAPLVLLRFALLEHEFFCSRITSQIDNHLFSSIFSVFLYVDFNLFYLLIKSFFFNIFDHFFINIHD